MILMIHNCQVVLLWFLFMLSRMVHVKCRNGTYPFSQIKRIVLSDEQLPWNVKLPTYDPPEYNSKALLNKPWADPPLDDESFNPNWNHMDGKINRMSYTGEILVWEGRPLNPGGRTGIKGRGLLGRWGPNHAADPVVTRWKRLNGQKEIDNTTKLPILQFCAVQRKDCGQWAIPGGMVDPGEQVSETLKREFQEEALNSLEASPEQVEENKKMLENFFSKGEVIYRGYVDDPRNTDNAWIETVAVNFHDEDGSAVGKFNLQAGDDAQNVRWMDIHRDLNLYASHSNFIQKVVEKLKAHS